MKGGGGKEGGGGGGRGGKGRGGERKLWSRGFRNSFQSDKPKVRGLCWGGRTTPHNEKEKKEKRSPEKK